MDTIKPETPVELPSPKEPETNIPFEEKYRGFSDDFSKYKIVSHIIQVPKVSFNSSKKLKEIGIKFDNRMKEFIKNSLNDSSGSMLDAEDEFLEAIADFIFPEQKQKIFSDEQVPRPTLFRACKDLFSFLMATGTNQELKLSREQ